MSTLLATQLYYRFNDASPWVLSGLGVELQAGDACVIVGDNGCGKTTLGKVLTGLYRPVYGEVYLTGSDVHRLRAASRITYAGYMAQVSYLQFFTHSLVDEIESTRRRAASRIGEEDLAHAYSALGLPNDRTTNPLDLSPPQMWRFQLLLFAVVMNPLFLFIDEIVGPSAEIQRSALQFVLDRRHGHGQITVVAYQRQVRNCAFTRKMEMVKGTLQDA